MNLPLSIFLPRVSLGEWLSTMPTCAAGQGVAGARVQEV